MADDDEDTGGGPPEEEEPCPEGAPEWVVTFGDMMSLLLTFFILLLSFAEMELVKYKVLANSVMQAFGVQEITPAFSRPQGTDIVKTEFAMQFDSQNALDGMKSAAERHHARTPSGQVDIEVFEDYRGIVVAVGEEEMFEPGKADLRPAVWPFLDDVLEKARQGGAQIQVHAHTDSVPLRGGRFGSNDHLSAARAVAVVRYFGGVARDLPAHRLEAVPFGPHRPIRPNTTESGRAKNRRIELVFYGVPKDFRPPE